MSNSSVEYEIGGTYQLDALRSGWRFQRAWHRARLDLVARVLPPAPQARSLDAAAGAGILTWRFRAPRIVSVDLRPAACRTIRQHTPGALATAGLLEALPLRSGSFDQLYLLEAIEHLSEEHGAHALSELRRVARPGAQLLVTTPNYRSYWVVLERVLDGLRLTPRMADGQHQFRYDGGRLRHALELAGWRVNRLGSFNLAAPLIGMASERAGSRAIAIETMVPGRAGALLFACCTAA